MSTTTPASTLARVTNLIADVAEMEASVIQLETRLDEIWIDSMDRIEFGMWVEDDFAIEIPDEDTVAWRTVGDVVAYLDRRRPAARAIVLTASELRGKGTP